jgi:hypothetical protein
MNQRDVTHARPHDPPPGRLACLGLGVLIGVVITFLGVPLIAMALTQGQLGGGQ